MLRSYGLVTPDGRRGYVPRLDATSIQLGDLSTLHRLQGSPTSVASHLTLRWLQVWHALDARDRTLAFSLS